MAEPTTEAGRRLSAFIASDEPAVVVAVREAILTIEAEARASLCPVLRGTLSALALTFTSVPTDAQRPHWCRFPHPRHDATCQGMMKAQDDGWSALAQHEAEHE